MVVLVRVNCSQSNKFVAEARNRRKVEQYPISRGMKRRFRRYFEAHCKFRAVTAGARSVEHRFDDVAASPRRRDPAPPKSGVEEVEALRHSATGRLRMPSQHGKPTQSAAGHRQTDEAGSRTALRNHGTQRRTKSPADCGASGRATHRREHPRQFSEGELVLLDSLGEQVLYS